MKTIVIGSKSYASNTYLLVSGRSALVIDPSASVNEIYDVAKREGAEIIGALLTHGHFDHLLSLETLTSDGVNISIHRNDAEMLTDGKKNAFYTFFGKDKSFPPADTLLNDDDVIALENEKITVIHTPGHTKGSVCYMCENSLITGDTLFAESYGRCDLYGGSIEKLRDSMKLLRELPPETVIFPGHGGSAKLKDALDTVAYFL